MSDNELLASFEGFFGQAMAATLIPYLVHGALIQLSEFNRGQGDGVPVLAGNRPKKPSDQVNHDLSDKAPPVHKFWSVNYQSKLNPKNSSQGSNYIQCSTGGEKENESESKEGEAGEGFGEYSDFFDPIEESDGYLPPVEEDQEEDSENDEDEDEDEELTENAQEEEEEGNENSESDSEELVENDQSKEGSEKNKNNEGEIEESAEKEIQEEVEQLKEQFLQTLDSHSERIDKLIAEVEASNSLIGSNSDFEATWNQNAAAYSNLSEEIEELQNSMLDQGLDSKELDQMMQKHNELIQEQENLVSIMEHRTLAILAEVREKNIREQEHQVESEEQSERESTREQIRQIVEEKFLNLLEYVKAQNKVYEVGTDSINDQCRDFIAAAKDFKLVDLKDIENDIESKFDAYDEQYMQIAENIQILLDQQLALSERSHENISIDGITAKIESLLNQQSDLIDEKFNFLEKTQEEAAMKIIKQLYMPVLMPVLRFSNSHVYRTIKEQGDLAELWVAQKICIDRFKLEPIYDGKLSGGRRGFDGVFKDSEGNIIILESKVCFSSKPKTFQSALGKGYGFQQASPEWIEAVAQRMEDNEKRVILDAMSQGKLKVMGTFIDVKSSTIQILEKNNYENNKRKWEQKDLFRFDSGIPDFRDR